MIQSMMSIKFSKFFIKAKLRENLDHRKWLREDFPGVFTESRRPTCLHGL